MAETGLGLSGYTRFSELEDDDVALRTATFSVPFSVASAGRSLAVADSPGTTVSQELVRATSVSVSLVRVTSVSGLLVAAFNELEHTVDIGGGLSFGTPPESLIPGDLVPTLSRITAVA